MSGCDAFSIWKTTKKLIFISCFFVMYGVCEAKNVPASNNITHNSDRVNNVTYYIDNTNGDDANTGVSETTAWRSIQKVNWAEKSNLIKPGDNILFKKGQIFQGTLSFTEVSGTSNSPITIGVFGSSGDMPVIDGFLTVTDWKKVGNGIWECNCPVGENAVNMVLIDGKPVAMGRYPNADGPNGGYLNIKTHIKTSNIFCPELTDDINWQGAEVVIRKKHWILDRNIITKQANGNIEYISASAHEPGDGYGFFIQNSYNTLDEFGEWYYNPKTKKLDMYFGSENPSSRVVKVTNTDTLLNIANRGYYNFQNISFEGSNSVGINMRHCTNVSFTNCNISFSGSNAFIATICNYLSINNCRIFNTNNNALNIDANNSSITSSTIRITALLPGMGASGDGTYIGVRLNGDNNTAQFNRIDSTGYTAFSFNGNSVLIKNNVIDGFDITKDDGGGIYTFNAGANAKNFVNRKVIGNIVINGKGALYGTSAATTANVNNYRPARGIYMDGNSSNVDIENNTVANMVGSGIYINGAHEINIKHNTTINCGSELQMIDYTAPNIIKNDTVENNIFCAVGPNQLLYAMRALDDNILKFGLIDNNYFITTQADNSFVQIVDIDNTQKTLDTKNKGVDDWKADYNKDMNSKLYRIGDNKSNYLFYYNTGRSLKIVDFNGDYKDCSGNSFVNRVELQPYSSIILIK
jgi:hypothetical protein